ncbi:LAMI_0D05490g1_1 [Lachancea mirantina]|uniref:LAMI_0D05490g1_1 n=1 Tax=Lachancea mirantina TaxID=1230905 RepID=A0A1G4JB56_9SACH|nr:LAMI_0D05490g1_1 [Lachancea mirantina]
MSSLVQGLVKSFAEDWAENKWDDYAGEKLQPTKDPFYCKMPNGKRKRRKLPEYCTQKEKKLWKKLQNRAWKHDRCMCGCIWVNWGLGLAPVLSILPTIGPIIMYWIHSKLISMADKELNLPPELLVKLHGNIVIDLLISLPPIIGTLFAWMNACSTRNCAMIYNYMVKRASKQSAAQTQTQSQTVNSHLAQTTQNAPRNAVPQQYANGRTGNAVNVQRPQPAMHRQVPKQMPKQVPTQVRARPQKGRPPYPIEMQTMAPAPAPAPAPPRNRRTPPQAQRPYPDENVARHPINNQKPLPHRPAPPAARYNR